MAWADISRAPRRRALLRRDKRSEAATKPNSKASPSPTVFDREQCLPASMFGRASLRLTSSIGLDLQKRRRRACVPRQRARKRARDTACRMPWLGRYESALARQIVQVRFLPFQHRAVKLASFWKQSDMSFASRKLRSLDHWHLLRMDVFDNRIRCAAPHPIRCLAGRTWYQATSVRHSVGTSRGPPDIVDQ